MNGTAVLVGWRRKASGALIASACAIYAPQSWAVSAWCAQLDAKASGTKEHFLPPMEGKVIAARGIYLRSAPNVGCKVKKAFIKPGTFLTVYQPYRGWFSVMHVAKDGETPMGWVRERELRLIKAYGAGAIDVKVVKVGGSLNAMPIAFFQSGNLWRSA